MRSKPWKHRGKLVLTESKSKRVRAVVTMTDCLQIKKENIDKHVAQHCVTAGDLEEMPSSYQGDLFAYVFADVVSLDAFDIVSNHGSGPTRPIMRGATCASIARALAEIEQS